MSTGYAVFAVVVWVASFAALNLGHEFAADLLAHLGNGAACGTAVVALLYRYR